MMSFSEQQQTSVSLDSEAFTRMEVQAKSSHKYLLLQVWCGFLTVAMTVMAARLILITPQWSEDKVSTVKQDNISAAGSTVPASLKSGDKPCSCCSGASPSYIQLIQASRSNSWTTDPPQCSACSLTFRNDSIYFHKTSLYLLYAQVTFRRQSTSSTGSEKVILSRNKVDGKAMKLLVEGKLPSTAEGSVWVVKVVMLDEGDSVSLEIRGDPLKGSQLTFWGAVQLH